MVEEVWEEVQTIKGQLLGIEARLPPPEGRRTTDGSSASSDPHVRLGPRLVVWPDVSLSKFPRLWLGGWSRDSQRASQPASQPATHPAGQPTSQPASQPGCHESWTRAVGAAGAGASSSCGSSPLIFVNDGGLR